MLPRASGTIPTRLIISLHLSDRAALFQLQDKTQSKTNRLAGFRIFAYMRTLQWLCQGFTAPCPLFTWLWCFHLKWLLFTAITAVIPVAHGKMTYICLCNTYILLSSLVSWWNSHLFGILAVRSSKAVIMTIWLNWLLIDLVRYKWNGRVRYITVTTVPSLKMAKTQRLRRMCKGRCWLSYVLLPPPCQHYFLWYKIR